MRFLELLTKIPRRVIFLILAIFVIFPLFYPLNLTTKVSIRTFDLFRAIDSLKGDKPVLISIDFDPQSMPELYPMYLSLLRHCFAKDIPVIVLGLWITGVGIGEEGLKVVAKEYGKEYGKDYIFLGWKPGITAVILGLGRSLKETFPTDYYKNPIENLPLAKKVETYKDIPIMLSISAGSPGYGDWIAYAQTRYGIKIGAGVTAVSAADAYPYLQSGQLIGLLSGLKGASEYEYLVEKYGYSKAFKSATQLMDSQSFAHLIIMILVIIGNIGYFFLRRRK
jgi:hypothetical protein